MNSQETLTEAIKASKKCIVLCRSKKEVNAIQWAFQKTTVEHLPKPYRNGYRYKCKFRRDSIEA